MEEMRRAERARERRQRALVWTLGAVVTIGIAGGTWYAVDREADRKAARAEAAASPVKGEKSFKDLGRDHVTEPVDYPMSPAVGGDHDAAWMNCDGDVYDKEVAEPNVVHSLEHGAVWITYNDKAPDGDVDALNDRVEKTPYTLMSPYEDQKSPIVLSAWGKQLQVESASDPRVQQFLDKYVQGEQTPEPGAACTGGVSA